MEAEMKLMLEKMREYKAKDPSLFSQIWDQVKKVCVLLLLDSAAMATEAITTTICFQDSFSIRVVIPSLIKHDEMPAGILCLLM
jgi:hypothetical protein